MAEGRAGRDLPRLGASNRRFRLIRQLAQRKGRAALGLTLVEGARLTVTAAAAGAGFEMLLLTEEHAHRPPPVLGRLIDAGVEAYVVTEEVLRRAAATLNPQGILGIVRIPGAQIPGPPFDRQTAFLCLDGVADPGNAGTLIRGADAAGMSGVIMGGGVDAWNPKVLRAAMGSTFHLPVQGTAAAETGELLADLRGAGCRVICASPRAGYSFWETDLGGPSVLVLGNEAWGVGPRVLDQADALVSIPNFGRVESLNVAQAGTLLMYEMARQMRWLDGAVE